jgi:hypothetical protein
MSASLDSSRSAFAEEPQSPQGHAHHLMPSVVGEVDHAKNGFNPCGSPKLWPTVKSIT